MQNISFDLPQLLYGVSSALIGAVLWLWRKVGTNEKKVAVIESELRSAAKNREAQNDQTKETLTDLKSDITELRNDIKSLLIQNKVGR